MGGGGSRNGGMVVRWVVRAGEIGMEETEAEVVAHDLEGRGG